MNGGKDNMTTPGLAPDPGSHLELEDLMAYVLELLTPEEAERAEAHLKGPAGGSGCTDCLQQLAAVHEDLGAYALAVVPMQDAPTPGRERLLAAVAAEPRGAVSQATSTGRDTRASMGVMDGGKAARTQPARRATWAPWLGWGVAAAVALAAVHYYQGREALRSELAAQGGQIAQLSADEARAREVVDALTDPAAQRVTLTLTKAPAPVQPTGRATYLATSGTLIFIASHMAPLPAGKTYELWVIPANGKAPVSAGTFEPDERGSAAVVTAKLEPGLAAKAFGITIEAAGGASAPTPPILLAGS